LTDRRALGGGRVETCAGPWRTSGAWWVSDAEKNLKNLRVSVPPWPVEVKDVSSGWDRDEWDVTVSDGATYRLFRERHTDAWFIEGIVD
jgi:hypothetical protein